MDKFPTIKKLRSKKDLEGARPVPASGLGISAKTVEEVEEELRPKSADELAGALADKADAVTKGDKSSKAAEIRARAALVRAKAKKLRELEGVTDADIRRMKAEMPKKKK